MFHVVYSILAGLIVSILFVRFVKHKPNGAEMIALFVLLFIPVLFGIRVHDFMSLLLYSIPWYIVVIMAYDDYKTTEVYDVGSLIVLIWGVLFKVVLMRQIMDVLWGVAIMMIIVVAIRLYSFIRFRNSGIKIIDHGFGNGDVFLLLALAVVFGINVTRVFFLAALSAVILLLPLVAMKHVSLRQYIPYVPFIMLGTLATILTG